MEQTITQYSPEQASELEGRYLTFLAADQLYGVSIADVVQIVGIQEITPIPAFPPYAKGVVNLRGSIIPVIDMRLRLEQPEQAYDERTCIIVTLVEAVDAVTPISPKQIAPPPPISQGRAAATYLVGIAQHEGKVVLLLDLPRLIGDQTLNTLMEAL